MPDLALSPRARRVTAIASVVVLGGLAMTMIVFADNNHWGGALALAAALGVALYVLGTPAYRAQPRGPGRVQLNTVLGNHQVDLRNGYRVKRGLGPVVVLKVGRKRYRINSALGHARAIDEWMSARQHDLG